MRRKAAAVILGGLLAAGLAEAKVDLVTLPEKDATQLTIYNAADLTLVRETRTLTLKKGTNRLEFGWANTLIDPTSVQINAPKHAAQVRLLEVSYPPDVQGSAVWTIESAIEGAVPVEITFFTSGLSWRAFYMGTLSPDESAMRLEGYVRVENRSGEDYENASTRVIVGKIHTVDEVAALARRTAPYGVPTPWGIPLPQAEGGGGEWEGRKKEAYREMARAGAPAGRSARAPKEITREGLSEYFLYTIEGTETIANGWGKRLPSFAADGIPVANLYKYEEERWGRETRRFVFFANDEKHKLGQTPLPDGAVKIYRQADPKTGHLAFTGSVVAKYIPVGEEAELDLGGAPDVKITPKLMSEKTANHLFGEDNQILGFDRQLDWEITIENGRSLPVKIEIIRNMPHPDWEIANGPKNPGAFEKTDADSVKYTLEIAPHAKETLTYALRLFEGERRNRNK